MTIDVKQLITYWKQGAEHSFDIAEILFSKRKYPEALFFGQLTLEKLLKGLVVQRTKKMAPLIHDLALLANKAKLKISKEQEQDLAEMTDFHIAGRYDDIKQAFRKKCTPTYSKKYFALINSYYKWLKNELSHNQ